jgi:hypothetical protein
VDGGGIACLATPHDSNRSRHALVCLVKLSSLSIGERDPIANGNAAMFEFGARHSRQPFIGQ